MKSQPSSIKQTPNVALFQSTSHSPSYASLTNNFEHAGLLKDYCIPVNSYFPTPGVMQELYQKLPYALKYYPSGNSDITKLICEFADIADQSTVLAGNGSTELISWLNTVFIKDDVLIPVPSFGRWTDEPKALGRSVKFVNYEDANEQELTPEAFVMAVRNAGVKNAVLCNPNNPTGSIMTKEEVLWVMKELSHLDNLIIDESFIDFSFEQVPTVKDEVANFKNTWVLKSLGKNLGLHGLRMAM
jgi:histidinol-phosphate/aromatic aminotransferase/cobyric acid decarboxylase-like protein